MKFSKKNEKFIQESKRNLPEPKPSKTLSRDLMLDIVLLILFSIICKTTQAMHDKMKTNYEEKKEDISGQ